MHHSREKEGGTQICIKVKVHPSSPHPSPFTFPLLVNAREEEAEARKGSSHRHGLRAASWSFHLALYKEFTMSGFTWWAQISQKMETACVPPWSKVHQPELGSPRGRVTCSPGASWELSVWAHTELLWENVSVSTTVKYSREGLYRTLQPNWAQGEWHGKSHEEV